MVCAAGRMFWWTFEQFGDLDMVRTVAMTQMVVFQLFHVVNSRSLDQSVFSINYQHYLVPTVSVGMKRWTLSVL